MLDFRQDARFATRPPTQTDTSTAVDIISIDYGCEISQGRTLITATMRTSGLETVPPSGSWRMNFATNPTVPGASDRADQWFVAAQTDATGARSFAYGTAVRNSDGSIAYTRRGTADAGHFDLTARTVTVKVNLDALNALQTRGAIADGTVLMGLRGSASVSVNVADAAGTALVTDSTRGGRPFIIVGCAAQ